MGTLTSCIKKAGTALRAEDKSAILSRVRELRASGLPQSEASLQAVEERLSEVSTLLAEQSPDNKTAQPTVAAPVPAAATVEPPAPNARTRKLAERAKEQPPQKDSEQSTRDAARQDETKQPVASRADTEETRALKALSESDELFALPKSEKTTVQEIAADNDAAIQVKESRVGPELMFKLAMPSGDDAYIWQRRPNPYGPDVYGYDMQGGQAINQVTERPGGNPEHVDGRGEVWIDVSRLKEGGDGRTVYNIAQTYAHNTGRVFIGDPAGISDVAMRRRTEHMLSSALKFGTTDHLAPHPRQLAGDPDIGVPGLKWTYGDHLANIRELIRVSQENLKNAGDNPITFDPATGRFTDSSGRVLDDGAIRQAIRGGSGPAGNAGVSTAKRDAVLAALLREGSRPGEGRDGRRMGLLESLVQLRRQHAAPTKELFYSRGSAASGDQQRGLSADDLRGAIAPIVAAWKNGPKGGIKVVESTDKLPAGVGSTDPDGVARAWFDPRTEAVYLIAGKLPTLEEAQQALFHEVYGHYGLRSILGDRYGPELMMLRRANQQLAAEASAWFAAYGRDEIAARVAAGMDRLQAEREIRLLSTEEALADRAGKNLPIKGWERFVAALQKALRAIGLNHVADWLENRTEAEAAALLASARERVRGGEALEASGAAETAMASRPVKLLDSIADRLNKGPALVGQTSRAYTAEQKQAMENVGFMVQPPTVQEKLRDLWKDLDKKLAQGLVDQFAPVKDISKDAYGLLRLSKGAAGAFEVLLRGGQLRLIDGVYDFDESKRGGVVDRLLIPLQGEHHDFLRWVAANRAQRLKALGKENLFSEHDIAALKTLDKGVTSFDYTLQHGVNAGQVTRDRTLIYPDALRTFNEFGENVLDMAEASGLIDGEARKLWESEFYVPFFRVEEDGSIAGADIKNGAVRQQAFKSLTGRTNKLNADLLDNTLRNWAHLLDASAKNRAAKATIEAAEKMDAAQKVEGPSGKGTVWYREAGEKRYSFVNDPHLLTAVSALEYAGMRSPVMNAMSKFKHALTIGVTASPFFKIRNLIRDSVQVIGTSSIGTNPIANVAAGWKLTNPKNDAYFRLMAGGGTIHFGSMLEGSEAKRVQALVEAGVDDATILDNEHKVKAFYRRYIEPAIEAYNALGDRGEAINRAALYDQLVKQGVSHADASLQARDLMDFSMQGSFTSVRFLTQVVPFFNARIQGLYKLGRAAKEDPARFSAVLGATALFSLALLGAYGDDDDWKKREDWDRNAYWWFKLGGTAFRIPKPFEIGAIATLAERGFELMFDKEMTGKRFRSQVLSLLGDNLSMNPIPQLVKPLLDVYANKDSFTGRPIESMGMDKLQPPYRFNERTSMLARGASTAANAVTGLVGIEGPSPVQIDHLLRGYFGWLGSFVVGAGDAIVRYATSEPSQPAPDYWKTATGGMVSDLRDAPSRYVSQMYTQAREVEQAYGTWAALRKQGKAEDAAQYAAEHKDDLVQYRGLERLKRQEARLSAQIRALQSSDLGSYEKRQRLRELQAQKDRLARTLAPAT